MVTADMRSYLTSKEPLQVPRGAVLHWMEMVQVWEWGDMPGDPPSFISTTKAYLYRCRELDQLMTEEYASVVKAREEARRVGRPRAPRETWRKEVPAFTPWWAE